MNSPSLLEHLRDILILPFTVTVIIPHLIFEEPQSSLFISGYTVHFKIAGILVGMCGVSLFIDTVFLFKTLGHGTLAPWMPTQKLVIVGPYRYCRNPMITGVLFTLVGEGLFLLSTNILLWAASFFMINTVYFIFSEEPGLKNRFGDEYGAYKKQVPRWIPKTRPFKNAGMF